ncbi:MAG TPA: FAD-dependent oxidoreductase [Roseiflexaceae bacterium]|nr:FAD-dependent oxidoreductase [Roseiflexaceae bacterium]
MSQPTAEAVICGAGIAGVAAAYFLAAQHGLTDITLVERGDPLSLTSDKSTEAYRNWWPGPGDAMVALMNRSIDLLEQIAEATNNRIQLNRRGYLYASADPAKIPLLRRAAEEAAGLGAGALRIHNSTNDQRPTTNDQRMTEAGNPSSFVVGRSSYTPAPAHGFAGQPDGADLILDPALIRARFPYLSERTVAVLHARRCGWFSAQQLGMHLLEQARECGVRLLRGEVTGVDTIGGRVRGVRVATRDGEQLIATPRFVNAAGPLLPGVARLLGVELPVFSERHIKIAFSDHLQAVPRDAPMLICVDDITLPWSEDEREALAEDDETSWLLGRFPAGVHCRPEGHGASTSLLILWNYHLEPVEPVFPPAVEEHYAELALRGMAVMIPSLAQYFDRAPRPYIDGGYYTKTRENRPLIGPLPIQGAYIVGALSGYGLMAACAAGELLAAHITGGVLPHYAPAFALSRYDDPAYQALLEDWPDTGQL